MNKLEYKSKIFTIKKTNQEDLIRFLEEEENWELVSFCHIGNNEYLYTYQKVKIFRVSIADI